MRFLNFRLFLILFFPINSFSKEALVFSTTFSDLLVNVAQTQEEKQKGLMFVNKLSKTNGLLFTLQKTKDCKYLDA